MPRIYDSVYGDSWIIIKKGQGKFGRKVETERRIRTSAAMGKADGFPVEAMYFDKGKLHYHYLYLDKPYGKGFAISWNDKGKITNESRYKGYGKTGTRRYLHGECKHQPYYGVSLSNGKQRLVQYTQYAHGKAKSCVWTWEGKGKAKSRVAMIWDY